ncbi:MAG: DNA mismatch repair protein MutS [Betaproteobacteria bacterium]|nr:MAG: DNA mismatch repair protein MutS [Betaproteobacteria bacterium]
MRRSSSMRKPRHDHGARHSADGDEDFRQAVADVVPLKRERRHALKGPPPAPHAAQRRRDERAALHESLYAPFSIEDALESGEELTYLREGLSRQLLRRLRRGHWVVQSSLDLHGMNRVTAADAVSVFLRASKARGLRCVRIVHGKGLGSKNREPVLKTKLRQWLPPRDEVLAFCQAPAAHGGGGALLVMLKTR